MAAFLCINAWYGRSEEPVEVVGETPKRTRIRILRDGTLVPGGRRMNKGDELLVPKYTVKRTETEG